MSQASNWQGEPRDNGQGMVSSWDEELFGAPETPPTYISDFPPCSTHSGSVVAEAILPSSPPSFPPSAIPTHGSFLGGSGVSDEAYVPIPPEPIGPLSPEGQPVAPTAPADRFPSCRDEPLDYGTGFQPFGAPDAMSFSCPSNYSDYTSVDTMASFADTMASFVDHTNLSRPGQVSFLGEASDPIGLRFRHVTCPTPAVHAAASGRLQSNTRSATFPLSSYPMYSNHALHDVWAQHPPLSIYSSQDGMDDMPLVMSLTSLTSQGVPFPTGDMPLGPAAFSGPSGHAPLYDPSSGALAASNSPQIPSAISIPAPPKKMNSTQKHSIQRKRTSQAHKRGSTTQSHGGKLIKERARAQLVENSIVSYGDGCRLENVAALPAEFNAVAFEGQTFTQKASVRFEISPHRPFNCQFNVLHGGGRQPTKRRLAEVAARAVDRFIVDCEKFGRPCGYKLEHFVLRKIVVVSRSGLRLVFDLPIPATI